MYPVSIFNWCFDWVCALPNQIKRGDFNLKCQDIKTLTKENTVCAFEQSRQAKS